MDTYISKYFASGEVIDETLKRAQAGGALDKAVSALGVESPDYPGCYYRAVNGVMEWINPPFIVGVEYRTVERYREKPVYQKLVNFGTFPNTGTKSVTWADNGVVAAVIDVALVTAVGVYIGGPTLSGSEFTATKTLLYIKSTGDYSATTGIFKLKYTKTTD